MQEQRFYKKNKQKLNNHYPYERAENVARQIKRLGNTKSGMSYLDKFRQLITHIGNALGYVRMIKSASLKDNSNLRKYLPQLINNVKFEEVAEDLGIEGECMEAMKVFDMGIKNLFKQAEDAGDYLRMIVKNFDGIASQENTKHLKLFYLTVPALCISYIEHLQKGQEKITSKNKNVDGFISDDGFPLGVAYMLKILGQTEKFSGLNWFDSMFKKLQQDMEGAEEREKKYADEVNNMNMTYEDQKLDSEMSKRRIKNLKREYEMLHFCFSASSILFKEI
jgi:WASH complex subunit 7